MTAFFQLRTTAPPRLHEGASAKKVRLAPLFTSTPPMNVRLLLPLATVATACALHAQEISYNRDIRPILSENCFACHGPDKPARKADRRLDTSDGARAEIDGVRAIVPGDLAKSDAIARIESHDADEKMPPPKSDKKLTPEQIALIKKWIAQGGKYEPHWSFIAPRRPAVPGVRGQESGVRNPIDAFVLARLEKDGLKPSPEAGKPTLIRRVTFDLTGLPPTPAEVDAFLADQSPDAYGKLVARLLASPRFGEKTAVHWLDLSRYADTHGYHLDAGREMWKWREWVIEAFNKNLPFDQFILWQLAGDLLPNATTEQKVATGFCRNNMINFEGGAIAEEYLTNYIFDRVNTFGTAFLGLTVNCIQCHDHKFDPLTQKDYYQLYAYFNAVPENGLDGSKGNAAPVLQVPTPGQEATLAALGKKIADSEKQFADLTARADAAQSAWEKTATVQTPASWTVLTPAAAKSLSGATLAVQPDHSILASGANAGLDHYEITARTDRAGIKALRLEALTDPSLVDGGPGRAGNGNFVLTGIDVEAQSVADPKRTEKVRLVAAEADYSQALFEVAKVIDGVATTGWAVDGNTKHEARTAWFVAEKPFGFPGGTDLHVRLDFESAYAGHSIGRARLAVTADAAAASIGKAPHAIAQILAVPAEKRDAKQRETLQKHYRESVSPILKEPAAQLEKLRAELKATEKQVPNVMVMQQMDKPRATHILLRGQYNQPGEKVAPGTPASLPPLPADAPPNRLGLARWVIDPQHPLTARVAVNRFWKNFMGTGIVKTLGDFGAQGEWPSHPELLDWLAVEFVSPSSTQLSPPHHGLLAEPRISTFNTQPRPWDVKHLTQLIVTSAAYRQSARVTPEMKERDPYNRLYARGPRFRLSAEEIRDTALAVSGLLNPKIGGASVSPYQPEGLWEELSLRKDSGQWSAQFFVPSHGEDLYRRSMYTFWKRTCPPPQMQTFDAPDRETCTVSRERTNTPLQALVLLNDPTYVEAARILAERMMTQGGATPAERIRFAFRLATARAPSERETAVLTELFQKQKTRYAASRAEALKLLGNGEAKRNPALDPAELAAWTNVASTILNLDETVTKG